VPIYITLEKNKSPHPNFPQIEKKAWGIVNSEKETQIDNQEIKFVTKKRI
jgi:hypothetical protein